MIFRESNLISADFGFSINLVFRLFNSIFNLGTFLTFLLVPIELESSAIVEVFVEPEEGFGDFLLAVFNCDKGFESHSSCI